ncbi:hypothetical protein OQI_27875 [Streptomyces pharetrae CZA14]|uniref:Uncharacterized protein n=2 Tax=Streptomyces pharetrae TaxID=291370 RepID=A0ABX3YBT1_9ACTN|nr:hypothetical protein OQI_27875 [Streptomyces pharetrae CZA14]
MSGRADSDPAAGTSETTGTSDAAGMSGTAEMTEARRARWAATAAGALLALAGLAASALRLTAPVPALVPAAYAVGAGACALAGVLGSRGRTRRALWLLVGGVMVMALGDQFD